MLTVGSLFSGVGGFDLGLERAGMRVLWQVEIDPQARSVLRRHWPDVDLHEDVRNVGSANLAPVDLICGGFPCQDLSVAGRRAGLAGERSGLFYEFMRVVAELAPRWVLIENVPGLLSSNGGRDMGAVLGTLGELGYWWAYRVLDLQNFGVPQRRCRVFIVGHLGAPYPPEVLLEPESLCGDSAEGREARAGFAASLTTRVGASGADDNDAQGRRIVPSLIASMGKGLGHNRDDLTVAAPLTTKPYADNEAQESRLVIAQCHGSNVGPMGTLRSGNGNATGGVPFVADTLRTTTAHKTWDDGGQPHNIVPVPIQGVGKRTGVSADDPCAGIGIGAEGDPILGTAIPRRLTPRECERLMGWPDDWTRYGVTEDGSEIELADGPRYRMCGNGVGAPVAEWIGRRIVATDTAARKEVTDAA